MEESYLRKPRAQKARELELELELGAVERLIRLLELGLEMELGAVECLIRLCLIRLLQPGESP